jgi:hypothetical protein
MGKAVCVQVCEGALQRKTPPKISYMHFDEKSEVSKIRKYHVNIIYDNP